MRVTIDLPDDLYQALAKQATTKKVLDVNKRIKEILAEFHTVAVKGDRFVILKGKPRLDIERVLESTVHSGEELAIKVKNMSTVKVGDIACDFNETEQRQIQAQAEFWGEPPAAYVKRVAKEAFQVALGVW